MIRRSLIARYAESRWKSSSLLPPFNLRGPDGTSQTMRERVNPILIVPNLRVRNLRARNLRTPNRRTRNLRTPKTNLPQNLPRRKNLLQILTSLQPKTQNNAKTQRIATRICGVCGAYFLRSPKFLLRRPDCYLPWEEPDRLTTSPSVR